jgi:hypothetical protein
MGSDDLHNKRKARKGDALARQKKERARSPRYLIVCEGSKTEPNYLRELVVDLRIQPQTVKTAPNDGTSPDRIVAHARTLYEEEAASGDSFDKVFCVFDRDCHASFDAAVQQIRDWQGSEKPKPFEAITSSPCFEYWLLLHFGLTEQPFHAAGKKSVCDSVITVLRKKPDFKTYGKGKHGIYALLKDKTSTAIKAAQSVRENSRINGQRNTLTHFDELVEALQALAKLQNGA